MSTRLPKVTKSRKKRPGRGYGSGLGGHTAGRGMKGQKARAGGKRHILFEGVKSKKSLLRRLPFLRGKGKFVAKPGPAIVKLGDLNDLKEAKITLEAFVKAGVVTPKQARENGVKVLSGGVLERKIEVNVPVSKAAGEQIIARGGKIDL